MHTLRSVIYHQSDIENRETEKENLMKNLLKENFITALWRNITIVLSKRDVNRRNVTGYFLILLTF